MTNEWPTHLTEPAGGFLEADADLHGFLNLTRDLASRLDQIGELFRDYSLRNPRLSEEQKAEIEKRSERAAQDALGSWGDLIREMEYSRVVDNYLTYVAELLALLFRTRPETMKSKKQVSIEFILDHESRDDLVDTLAEDQVDRLSRAGLWELQDELQKSLGFKLFVLEDAARGAARAVAIRNLIVHKRGVVDRRFQKQLPEEDTKIGEPFPLTDLDAATAAELFQYAVRDTDPRAVEKWDLPTPLETADYFHDVPPASAAD
jgi:hypothetical protein